ncbi:50S ribosome-binding GTPase [Paraoerskovia marina]|uniref:50S ribosome-binding GTPase n=1 Tax=Paraoerskovia marina TaxID=545619 RepID=A0A1H1UAS2_9CELL|nr:GTP-binding protein [Paraoerskovia marina]SDS69575.1 50S ribosome-binding GTPase [Paraoerskovia marina]
MTSHDRDLRERTDQLQEAVDLAGVRLDPAVATPVRQAIAGVRERLSLGVDHTVVALAGGTGSGKSSLFNRLSRLDFADVGIKRPTTAQITACSWSTRSGRLLDWLEVIPERRIARGDELDAADEQALAGLILLDLPDHDSIEAAHRAVVDRVLPFVDLLIWVVDPQKYADDSLHSDYLRQSVGYEASMVVAVNQIDTVPTGQRENLVADMESLLRDDGLDGVHVATVSAATGEGISHLVDVLEEAVARRSVAAGRVAGELDSAAALLLSQTPEEAPWSVEDAVTSECDALADAVGLEPVAAQVSSGVMNGYGRPRFDTPQLDAVALSRSRWLSRSGKSLRSGWRTALNDEVSATPVVAERLVEGLERVDLDTRGPRSAGGVRVAWMTSLALAVVAGVLAALGALGVVSFDTSLVTTLGAVAVVLLVVGLVLVVVGAVVRRRLARRRRDEVLAAGRSVVEAVVQRSFVEPTQAVLGEYRRVRLLAEAAREAERLAPVTGALRLPTASEIAARSTGSGSSPAETGEHH